MDRDPAPARADEAVNAITLSFEIDRGQVEVVKRKALVEAEVPLMEEYDFHADAANANIALQLKPGTKIRPYQVGRARRRG